MYVEIGVTMTAINVKLKQTWLNREQCCLFLTSHKYTTLDLTPRPWDTSLPRSTKMTGVLTLRRRECSPVLLEFPDRGKKLPVRKATNCSLQSAGALGGNRVAGRVTEAKAMEFWRERGKKKRTHARFEFIVRLPVHPDYCECRHNRWLWKAQTDTWLGAFISPLGGNC